MKAVILAGGKGTRLAEYTREIPKPMLKVGPWPILEHQVRLLKQYNITDIIILVNYLKESIIDHFGKGEKLGVKISYFEEPSPLGTVGGIKEIENILTEDFIVVYGDVMVNMDLNRLITFHKEKKSQCTLVLHPNDHPLDSDLVNIDTSGRITAFYPKPHDPGEYFKNLVNAGLYIFSPLILSFIKKGIKADFGRDIFPDIFSQLRMYGYNTSEYLKDMGTPDRWDEVSNDFTSGKTGRKSFGNNQKAIFLDRDGVLNIEQSFIHKPEDLKLYDFTARSVKKINASDFLSIVITNQSVIARNLCTIEELETIHNKLETELGQSRAKLDAIYYCPHHPDSGFPEENPEFKTDCECRKPKPGLFLKAAGDYNIDLSQSFMIGDSERDILAGKNAGCTTIGVMSGYGIKKTSILPDYFFKNLEEAVDFIIDEPYANEFKFIFNKFSRSGKKPFVIALAGNAKAGKSNFARWMQKQFSRSGYNSLIMELDHWIVPEETRKESGNVYDRFQVNLLEEDIKNFFKGKGIHRAGYAHHPERESNMVNYQLGKQDVIIFEGIVALSIHSIKNNADMKIFLEPGEKVRKQRFVDYYLWREKELPDIERLFEKRKADEYQLIEKESKLADFIINVNSL
ncbi:MAG: HAD-IIIA family hydrolase [Bacteroidales bacterium]|nr:HAD-IIIA family hydrolase [Bacteroidales bacterium]